MNQVIDDLTFILNYFGGSLDLATWSNIKDDANAPVWHALQQDQQRHVQLCACGTNPVCACA